MENQSNKADEIISEIKEDLAERRESALLMQNQELSKRLRAIKPIIYMGLALIVIMGILLMFNYFRLSKCQEAYSDGFNVCAEDCNEKLDYFRMICTRDNPMGDIEVIPVVVVNGTIIPVG